MPDDPTPAGGQDPQAGTPADGQDPAGTTQDPAGNGGTEPGGAAAGGSDPAGTGSGSGQDPDTFDRAYVEGLRRESAERRTRMGELETQLGERDTALTESRAATTAAEDRATNAERKLERIEVAIAKKLPLEFAERLQGDNREALESDADRLAALVKPAPDFDGGARQPAPGGKSMTQLIREKAGASTAQQ